MAWRCDQLIPLAEFFLKRAKKDQNNPQVILMLLYASSFRTRKSVLTLDLANLPMPKDRLTGMPLICVLT